MSRLNLEVVVEVVRQTDKALLVDAGFGAVWIPKSQVRDMVEVEDGLYEITVPEWLYDEKKPRRNTKMIPTDELVSKVVALMLRSHTVAVVGVDYDQEGADDAPYALESMIASTGELTPENVVELFDAVARAARISVERMKIVDAANDIINENETEVPNE
jgi:hypothetical protein